MKKNLFYILTTVFLWNCMDTSTLSKEDFIGIWNNFPNRGHNHIQFYQDSAVFWDHCSYVSAEWFVENDTLYFKQLKGTIKEKGRTWFLPFRLNKSQDSLTLIMPEGNDFETVLFKVEDEWTHYLKGLDIDLEIPLAGMLASHAPTPNTFPELYIGWKYKKPAVRIDYYSEEILKRHQLFSALSTSFNQHDLDSIYPIALIVDKNIPKSVVDSIKGEIYFLYPKNVRFFRVALQREYVTTYYGKINPNCVGNRYEWDWYGRWDDL